MRPVRVLIVDDSMFIRRTLAAIVKGDPQLDVAGLASDGVQAVEMAAELKPDIITMDINMPKMNGLEALKIIMEKSPTAVLMVSQHTEEGAQATMEALSTGAMDFVTKSGGDSAVGLISLKKKLLVKIKELTQTEPAERSEITEAQMPDKPGHPVEMVAIGLSTGGPRALQELMANLPENFPAGGVIIQHIPATFIKSFAERLNMVSKVAVKIAENGEPVQTGIFLVAPGHTHLKFRHGPGPKPQISTWLDPQPMNSMHRPSVDQTLLSLADAYPRRGLGVIMTGMGQDGLIGARAMKEKGCTIVTQDKKSSVVYGMPRAVMEDGLAVAALPIRLLSEYIILSVNQ
ncbi:MAG: chemotaxis response regulator protein-glutamate methylesterase [bacterium]|nr:MAG: chemotaxis response regulator protein-glutamate methylesterase [bacterium]